MTAKEIIEFLKLEPLETEGGFFRETYRSELVLNGESLSSDYIGPRNVSTCIYYLLRPGDVSALHSVKSDEIFHFYLGGAVRMLRLFPDGSSDELVLGSDITKEQVPQVVVTAGTWQGCVLDEHAEFALMGCTVAPGFDYKDFELGNRAELLEKYPGRDGIIMLLTKE